MNVTEQSFTLSCYASGEILSATQKRHTAITVKLYFEYYATKKYYKQGVTQGQEPGNLT